MRTIVQCGAMVVFLAGCDAAQSSIDRCTDFRVQDTIESYQGIFGRGWSYRFGHTVCVTYETKIAKP